MTKQTFRVPQPPQRVVDKEVVREYNNSIMSKVRSLNNFLNRILRILKKSNLWTIFEKIVPQKVIMKNRMRAL